MFERISSRKQPRRPRRVRRRGIGPVLIVALVLFATLGTYAAIHAYARMQAFVEDLDPIFPTPIPPPITPEPTPDALEQSFDLQLLGVDRPGTEDSFSSLLHKGALFYN